MYTTLNAENAEIRLLRVLSDTISEHINCEMQIFSLQDAGLPVYKALSYRWGVDLCEHEIRLNSKVTCVRKNLLSFLVQMQLEKRGTWFFVDALCINQDDAEERAHQVNLMGRIYLGAEEVMAWMVQEPYYLTDDGVAVCYAEDDAPPADAHLSLDELKQLVMYNSFWSRLWIVQEVLLAKRLTLRMGGAEIEWMNLLPESGNVFNLLRYNKVVPTESHMLTMGAIVPHHTPYSNEIMASQILSFRRSEYRALRRGKRLPFYLAIDFFSFQKCSRLHDKAFGVLGFTQSRLAVDYSTSTMEIWMAILAEYLISLGFLTAKRERLELIHVLQNMGDEVCLLAPFVAFGFNPFDPVVYLVSREIISFFTLDCAVVFLDSVCITWWFTWGNPSTSPEFMRRFRDELEFKSIVSSCIRLAKIYWNAFSTWRALKNQTEDHLKLLAAENREMTAPHEGGETKTYEQWVNMARTVSENMLERSLQSGEDIEGDLDDDAWTLVG